MKRSLLALTTVATLVGGISTAHGQTSTAHIVAIDAGAKVAAPDKAPTETKASADAKDTEVKPDAITGASAPAENPATKDPAGYLSKLLSDVRGGEWAPAIAIALMFLVAGIRKLLTWRWNFWKGKAGGYILGYGSAFALTVAAAIEGGGALSLSLVFSALMLAWSQSGSFTGAKDFLAWLRTKFA